MSLPGQGADVPHLMQHLKDAFVTQQGTADDSARSFWDFCADYLDKHRMVEQWPADRNIGLKLSNNVRVLLSPATAAGSGDMQDSGSVSITKGQTQPGQEGVDSTAAKHIT